jgi:peroxiredoxin family protein
MTRVAAIVTVADPERLRELVERCGEAARAGASVTLFFRDESIPLICREEIAAGLVSPAVLAVGRAFAALLAELKAAGDVQCYACSSSMYVWGVRAADLIPALNGARGLIAFLADDLAEATGVLSF